MIMEICSYEEFNSNMINMLLALILSLSLFLVDYNITTKQMNKLNKNEYNWQIHIMICIFFRLILRSNQ